MATFIGIAGLAMSALSSVQQGQQSAQNAETQNQIAFEKAGQIEDQAVVDSARAEAQGAEAEGITRKAAKFRRGTNILNIARSGVLVEGSPLKVMNEIALETEKEASGKRFGAEQTAADIRNQAALTARELRIGGGSALAQGSFNQRRSLFQGAGTLLKGASAFSGGGKIQGSNAVPSGAFNPRSLAV